MMVDKIQTLAEIEEEIERHRNQHNIAPLDGDLTKLAYLKGQKSIVEKVEPVLKNVHDNLKELYDAQDTGKDEGRLLQGDIIGDIEVIEDLLPELKKEA